ncbi:MAG: hypothetical protein II249_03200 [Bacteroidaceae bacterium]|nr:hypothetical protein [Bacteroidaceae bacterium]
MTIHVMFFETTLPSPVLTMRRNHAPYEDSASHNRKKSVCDTNLNPQNCVSTNSRRDRNYHINEQLQ